MSYQGYQGQTGHHKPYPPYYPDQRATHPGTYGLPLWAHAYGHDHPLAHGMVSAIPLTLAADYPVGGAIVVDSMSLMRPTPLSTPMLPRDNMGSQRGTAPRRPWDGSRPGGMGIFKMRVSSPPLSMARTRMRHIRPWRITVRGAMVL